MPERADVLDRDAPATGERTVAGAPVALRADRALDDYTAALQARMYSPLCGLLTSVGGLLRTRQAPAFFLEGAELTGVHVRQNLRAPRANAYHIGGFGLTPFESRIRVLGEALERYSGHAMAFAGALPVRHASHAELVAAGEPVLPAEAFGLFRPEQTRRDGFPFEPFDPGRTMGWIEVRSLVTGRADWVPAQFFLLGYALGESEPWLCSAVTTGTGAHVTAQNALRSGLEEIVQVDAAVGHWYGRTRSTHIESDARTARLDRLIDLSFGNRPRPEFHLLPSADLPGLTVACVLRAKLGVVPSVAVGLGSGGRLERVMYGALLEAIGVQSFAAWTHVSEQLDRPGHGTEGIYDLEGNVGHYAAPGGAGAVEERFADSDRAPAGSLPPDDTRPDRDRLRDVVRAFRDTGKRLYHHDFTTVDLRSLGFFAARLWSPDTLSLCFPSAPPAAHRRFEQYGGFTNRAPHPYP